MLIGLDETLYHQTPDPFAVVATSDHRFFDRYWFSGLSPDGRTAFFAGTGRYPNMGTRDAFFNVLRDDRQHNLRVAAPLEDPGSVDVRTACVGPFTVTVVEPFRRLVLRNSRGPLSTELEFTTDATPHLEARHREMSGTRVIQEQHRYDQVGRWNGWLEVDGERIDVCDWWGDRDHSWGTRVDVGGLEPRELFRRTPSFTIWCNFSTDEGWGLFQSREYADGTPRYLDGTIHSRADTHARVVDLAYEITYVEGTRTWARTEFDLSLSDGRSVRVEAQPHTVRPWASRGGGYNRGFSDGLGFGARRGEVTEYDVYELPDARRVFLDGVEIDPGHREQLARITVDGAPGWAHLPIMPRSGDMTAQGA
ncbi:hypothetical protein DIZ27_34745 [Streptomyces sp. NWU339]|uniref:hypothetical protein n=1 Tax=Streptomyces sp. NWU339 TaxID=2185284 RepID=UPI000D68227B|nr:hypothetical protein [Streptomyces sp. NWU339]PWI06191.1 hypothetical protein DIZ27_34745 [Streptomyces sp. NWU339]